MTNKSRHIPTVCLLKKSLDVPTQQGMEKLSRGELVVVLGNNGENKTISLYLDSSQNFSCPEKLLKQVSSFFIRAINGRKTQWPV